ncbi:hypothetical protein Taro_018565, partial [Colocasia esculenta]|nr:hypothetical protein [Colocasia esculenta]
MLLPNRAPVTAAFTCSWYYCTADIRYSWMASAQLTLFMSWRSSTYGRMDSNPALPLVGKKKQEHRSANQRFTEVSTAISPSCVTLGAMEAAQAGCGAREADMVQLPYASGLSERRWRLGDWGEQTGSGAGLPVRSISMREEADAEAMRPIKGPKVQGDGGFSCRAEVGEFEFGFLGLALGFYFFLYSVLQFKASP